jgi:hypothetical protein
MTLCNQAVPALSNEWNDHLKKITVNCTRYPTLFVNLWPGSNFTSSTGGYWTYTCAIGFTFMPLPGVTPPITPTATPTPTITPTPPITSAIVVVAPVTETRRITTSNGTVIEFPAGTFNQTVAITMTPLSNAEVPKAGSFKLLGMAFDLHAIAVETGLPVQPLAGMSYTVSVPYDETALGGLDESSLRLYHWNGREWVVEPMSYVDTVRNVVYARINHFSIWSVGAGYPIYVPLAIRK